MLHIAIAEDSAEEREKLGKYLETYRAERDVPLFVHPFQDGDELLEDYAPGRYDILLLDIQMARVNGMEVAEQVRKVDDSVLILFITNMVNYAVQGYAVQALDFVVKPVSYPVFARKLDNAVAIYRRKNAGACRLKTVDGMVSLQPSEILYAELTARKLFIHTRERVWQCSATLSQLEEKLDDPRFFRCHSAILVNLEHVRAVDGAEVRVGSDSLPLSKHRRREFMDALTSYMGGRH